jgi:hypothetical protein
VIGRNQLRHELDWSSDRIRRAVRRQLFEPVTASTFRLASSPDTFASRGIAVALHVERRGFLSSWTAARLYGLRAMPHSPIHVTIDEDSRARLPEWAEVHTSSWCAEADRVHRNDGAVVASPLRMLFGLAAVFNQFRFERAAEDAWHLGLVEPAAAAVYLEEHRCRGKDGVVQMERWLERTLARSRPAQSGLELDLLRAIDEVGLPTPERQFPLELIDGETIHLDIAWPRVRLGVEPGAMWWHGGDRQQRLDQARDVACGEVGWQILRFDETLRRDPNAAARRIVLVYQQRLRTRVAP